MKFAFATALLATAPAARAISMCCVGDWTVDTGPYENFDTSTNTVAQNRDQDVGCATCCQAYNDRTKYSRKGTDIIFEVKEAGTFIVGYGTGTAGAVAGGATLEVQFSQRQVQLEYDKVDNSAFVADSRVYKEAKFDPAAWQAQTRTCAAGHNPGFRFGSFYQTPTTLDGICGLTLTAWSDLFCNDGNGLVNTASYDDCHDPVMSLIENKDKETCTALPNAVDASCRGEERLCGMFGPIPNPYGLPGPVPVLSDGVLSSARGDIEFEQHTTWKDNNGIELGHGWDMQKVYIGEQTVPGHRDTRCFHASAANLKGCTDAKVSPNGIKFQLELNQRSTGSASYPRGSTDYWDACNNDDGTSATCATCFAVAVQVNKGSFGVSSHTADGGKVSWTLEDDNNGDLYDFTFEFEDLYNRNKNGNGVDEPSDFAKGVVVSQASDESGLVYVCAPRVDWDITSMDSDLAFLYDPEVSVAKRVVTVTADAAPRTGAAFALLLASTSALLLQAC